MLINSGRDVSSRVEVECEGVCIGEVSAQDRRKGDAAARGDTRLVERSRKSNTMLKNHVRDERHAHAIPVLYPLHLYDSFPDQKPMVCRGKV
jgi:hypothetical protein